VYGPGGIASLLPTYHTRTMTYGTALTTYNIGIDPAIGGRITYLPGGNWSSSTNHLPSNCDNFIFLRAQADFAGVPELEDNQPKFVYIPCYFPTPTP
jgi:hypothetical protein